MAKPTTTKDQKADKEEGPRSFAVFLNKLAEGECEREVSRQMHTLIRGLRSEALGRDAKIKGELSMKFRFTVPRSGPVAVSYDVSTKAPKKVTSEGYFWITEGGNLTHKNPKQEELPLREAPDPEERDLPDEETFEAREV
jgi:hypothetical protein